MSNIERFLHCKKCWQERPGDIAMKDYARLAVGLTPDNTIQVWCERHNEQVGPEFNIVPDPCAACA